MNRLAMLDRIDLWKLHVGKPADFFVLFEEDIAKYVEELGKKVTPIPEVRVAIPIGVAVSPATTSSGVLDQVWWHGGMRAPHLHFKDKVYPLTQPQWNAFSKKILKKFNEKLGSMSSVSFNQLIELSDVMNDMPGPG